MSHNKFWPKTASIVGTLFPKGYVKLSVTGATGLGTIPADARLALIAPEASGIRWRDDGPNPTATDGMLLGVDGQMLYDGDLTAFKMTAQSGTATVHVCFYS